MIRGESSPKAKGCKDQNVQKYGPAAAPPNLTDSRHTDLRLENRIDAYHLLRDY